MYNNSAKLQLVFKYAFRATLRCDLIVVVDHIINCFSVDVLVRNTMLSNPEKIRHDLFF